MLRVHIFKIVPDIFYFFFKLLLTLSEFTHLLVLNASQMYWVSVLRSYSSEILHCSEKKEKI